MRWLGIGVVASLAVACATRGVRAPAPISTPVESEDGKDTRETRGEGDELAVLLAMPPRVESFGAIRAWLEGQPEGPGRDAALARVLAGLEGWPDATRVAPDAWLYALAEGRVDPLWSLIRRVDVNFLDEQKFVSMVGSTAMASVTDLRVRTWTGKDVVLTALFGSANLRAITALGIAGFGLAGVKALLKSPMKARLKRLSLGAIEDEGARLVAGEPALRGLSALDVSLSGMSVEAARMLLTSASLQGLGELRISAMRDGMGSALASGFPGLRVLGLQSAQLRPEELQAVFAAGFFVGLEEIDLEFIHLDSASAAALGRSVGPRLRVLDLRYSSFGDAGMVALAGSPQVGGLRELRLDGVLKREGVLALVRSKRFTEVRATGFRVSGPLTRGELLELTASPRLIDHPQRSNWQDDAELLDLKLTPAAASAEIPKDAAFTLFRPAGWTPWMGTETRVDVRGRVVRRRQVPETGDKTIETGQLSPEVLRVLIAATRRVHFFTVDTDALGAHCRAKIVHLSVSATVTVTLDGATRTLNLSNDCPTPEPANDVNSLGRRIELLVEAHGAMGAPQTLAK